VRVEWLFRYVGEHYVNSLTESRCYELLFITCNLFVFKIYPFSHGLQCVAEIHVFNKTEIT